LKELLAATPYIGRLAAGGLSMQRSAARAAGTYDRVNGPAKMCSTWAVGQLKPAASMRKATGDMLTRNVIG